MKKQIPLILWVFLTTSLPALSNAAPSKVFVYCSEGSPSSFSPSLVTDGTSFNASSRTIYNRLVEFKKGSTQIEPALAESYKASKDGLHYTFNLRKGVKFHTTPYFKPTRDFNADDVLFTFNRARLDSHPFHKVGGGTYDYFDSMDMGKLIKDIKKVNDTTIEFVLNHPESPFIANLAMDFASIYSAEYADQVMKAGKPDLIDNQPIGTGPFVFGSYSKDNAINYTSNPTYFRGKSPLDRLVFAITPDPSVRLQKLKAGECQLATEPAPADLAAIKLDAKLELMSQPGMNVAYLAFNVKKKPFDNPLIRRAVQHALNRKSYIDAIYLGNAEVAKNPIPPTVWSYDKDTKDYEYSLEKSKALLAQAGFPNGFEADLWTMPVSRPYNPNGRKMGEMMQADLAKVGIKIKLVTYDWPTYLANSKKGEYSMIQLGWTGDNGDPDNFMYVNLSCAAIEGSSNRAFWCNPEFDKLLQQAKSTNDVKLRTGFYKKAQHLFKEQAPWATLAHSTVYRAMSKKVSGFTIDPLGGDVFYGVDLK